MHIVELPWHTRMDLTEKSDLKKAKNIFFENDYALRIDREIENKQFLIQFIKHFNDVGSLGFTAYGEGVHYDFLYQLPKLRGLNSNDKWYYILCIQQRTPIFW